MTNVSTLLTLVVVNIGLSLVIAVLFKNKQVQQLLNDLVSLLLGPAYLLTLLQSVVGKKIEFSEVVTKGFSFVLEYFVLSILISLALFGSFIALVIPFFFVLPRLVLAPYYLIDQKLDPVEAFKASWNQTKGHSAKVWGIIGVNILMALLVLTIIGIPVAIYLIFMYSAASTILYKYIVKQSKA